jgi:hypothetical protein
VVDTKKVSLTDLIQQASAVRVMTQEMCNQQPLSPEWITELSQRIVTLAPDLDFEVDDKHQLVPYVTLFKRS